MEHSDNCYELYEQTLTETTDSKCGIRKPQHTTISHKSLQLFVLESSLELEQLRLVYGESRCCFNLTDSGVNSIDFVRSWIRRSGGSLTRSTAPGTSSDLTV